MKNLSTFLFGLSVLATFCLAASNALWIPDDIAGFTEDLSYQNLAKPETGRNHRLQALFLGKFASAKCSQAMLDYVYVCDAIPRRYSVYERLPEICQTKYVELVKLCRFLELPKQMAYR
eukprot:scpid97902/ scgid15206/ 